jgi:hypothetical protein
MKPMPASARSRTRFANPALWAIAVVGILCAVAATKSAASRPEDDEEAKQVFYTTSDSTGEAEIWAIEISHGKITTRDVGSTGGGDCVSLALSPTTGELYSMCGPLFGNQQLATIDLRTGQANLFGIPNGGQSYQLAVMAMTFGADGTLYAVGDCDPNANFECTPGSDPNYNSLYTVNTATGAFTRVGSTGAPQFFMDLAIDRHGNMLGVTTTVNPSVTPAVLYRISPQTGKATPLVNLVGSNLVMGLAFGQDGRLYATDNFPNSGLYRIDINTGFETAIAALPGTQFFSSGLELINASEH